MVGAWPPIVPDMERAKTIIIIIITIISLIS